MMCPVCRSNEHSVKDSRGDRDRVYRIRRCNVCGAMFGTIEEEGDLDYVKRQISMIRNLSKKGD